MPEGEADMLAFPGYVRDEKLGCVLGHHPLTSEIQQKQLRDLLAAHKDCFAFKLDDLTGYTGVVGDFKLPLLHDGEIRQKCRPIGHKEREILDEKMGELRDSGFIVPCPTGKYTQNVVIVAKKDADGNFTDSRVC